MLRLEEVLFPPSIGIPIRTNSAHLLSYEVNFKEDGEKGNDVFSLNNSKFSVYVERIYPIKLEIKNQHILLSLQSCHLEIVNQCRLKNKPLLQSR